MISEPVCVFEQPALIDESLPFDRNLQFLGLEGRTLRIYCLRASTEAWEGTETGMMELSMVLILRTSVCP